MTRAHDPLGPRPESELAPQRFLGRRQRCTDIEQSANGRGDSGRNRNRIPRRRRVHTPTPLVVAPLLPAGGRGRRWSRAHSPTHTDTSALEHNWPCQPSKVGDDPHRSAIFVSDNDEIDAEPVPPIYRRVLGVPRTGVWSHTAAPPAPLAHSHSRSLDLGDGTAS